jgi:hypothetical protein
MSTIMMARRLSWSAKKVMPDNLEYEVSACWYSFSNALAGTTDQVINTVIENKMNLSISPVTKFWMGSKNRVMSMSRPRRRPLLRCAVVPLR